MRSRLYHKLTGARVRNSALKFAVPVESSSFLSSADTLIVFSVTRPQTWLGGSFVGRDLGEGRGDVFGGQGRKSEEAS